MKQLISMDEYGIFADTKDTARANSLMVAKMFDKQHKNVLADIANLDCSGEFNRLNFQPITYMDERNRKQKCYAMTRDGFTFLAMGYRGKKAAAFKEAYIKRFNEMEKLIFSIASTRKDYPMLTEAVKMAHDDPKPYHFSNEADLLNRVITGKSAKEFRLEHGIEKGASIRPYLAQQQIELMEVLQKVDTGLLISTPDYSQRKKLLEWYKMKWQAKQLPGKTA